MEQNDKSIMPPEEYILDIVGTQDMDHETTSVETHCPCTVSMRNERLYIQYIEEDVSRLIIVSANRIQLRALGDLASRLEFEVGCATSGEYHAPYGILSMQVNTEVLSINNQLEAAGLLTIHMEYELSMNGDTVSVNKLDLQVHKE